MKVAISGASGLVGSELSAALRDDGHAITRIVRKRERARKSGVAYWNPDEGEVDEDALEGHDVVIHLAGESLFGIWTKRRKEAIRRSRVQGTQLLSAALAGLSRPPSLLITASAVGIYGSKPPDQPLTEDAPEGEGFLPRVVRGWEAASEPAEVAGIRVARLRFGLVLSKKGGLLGTMLPPFRLGLGAVVGPGDQAWSWIALPEIARVVRHVIATPGLHGAINTAAPNAVSAREFSHTLGRVLHRPVPLHIPRAVVELAPGGMGRELATASARAVPDRLTRSGYSFEWPLLEPALRALLARS